jgi:hypothetical protein
MCAGNIGRKQHHAQEQAKREFAAQAAQQQQMFEQEAQMLRTQMEQNKPVPPPVAVGLNEKAARVTGSRSKRATQRQAAMGAASLRIPTASISTGGGAGTPSATAGSSVKLNIG